MNAIPASLGIYSVADAARLTRVPPRQIRGWLLGYAQRRGKAAAAPVLRRQHETRENELALGFLDLLEVAFLGRIVQAAERQGRAPSWRAIRTAAETARRVLGTDHPFAVRRIHTDGRRIFAEAQAETGDRALYDLVGDNYAIYDVLAAGFVASVEYGDDEEPRRWTPDGRFPRVVVDPRRSFGRPIEARSGAPAEALFDAWRAEGGNAARVAAFFGTDEAGVREAVGFQLGVDASPPVPLAA
ncbi:MAG: hypothetical protein K2X11_21210 [Acetobacteraceae bacterium]|nr:hypothetical protein [Acetobacteraceae bacterium]